MKKLVRTYVLEPTNGRKSFNNKAVVKVFDDGSEVLQSYQTDVILRRKNGEIVRLWDDCSNTVVNHVNSFCGLDKKEYLNLEVKENEPYICG